MAMAAVPVIRQAGAASVADCLSMMRLEWQTKISLAVEARRADAGGT